ncbi:MAG: hypothetical protein EA380_04725 [Phycisphaeraceae bacterium]|nr:MAG: hypothetical protein EA380_04725 [Phycisphaeraceae bacterium]
MPSLRARLQLVRRLPRRSRESTLIAALDAADTAEADAILSVIAEIAAETDATTLMRASARAWLRLSDDARRTWIALAGEHAPTHVEALARSESQESRLAAAGVSADLLSARLGIRSARGNTSLIHALRHGVHSADKWHRPILDAIADIAHQNTAGRDELDDTLAEIAARYEEHRHAGIIAAILARAEHASGALAEWLRRADEPGHLALRAAARRLEPTMPPRRALSLLSLPALAPIALDRLANLDSPDDQRAFLTLAHIARRPDIRERIARMSRAHATLPDDATLIAMPTEARRGFVRWLEILPINDAQRMLRAAARLADPDPFVRLNAVRLLAKLPAAPALDEAIFEFALDPNPAVAEAACDALAATPSIHRRAALADRFAILLRSPHPRVRAMAQRTLDSIGIAHPGATRRTWRDGVAFRRALRIDREAAIADLDAQIRMGDRSEALSALSLADRAQVCTELHDAIIESARHTDAYIAAKAVRTLHRLDSSQASAAMLGAMKHENPRVRAEAIELSARATATRTVDVQPHLTDPTPRVRANAIHAMLRTASPHPGAHATLAEMLGSADPSQRAAGLWLAERHATPDLADRLAHLVRTETDPRLRERARRSARILLARMRRGWTERQQASAQQAASAVA